jgi:hypothetical protein
MGDVTIEMSPEVRASDTFRPLIERANDWLRASVPQSDFPVRAEWTLVKVPGTWEEMAALSLRDEFGFSTRLFPTRILQDRAETDHALNAPIRDLLRYRTHKLLDRLQPATEE